LTSGCGLSLPTRGKIKMLRDAEAVEVIAAAKRAPAAT
jgi:hypothetical protein